MQVLAIQRDAERAAAFVDHINQTYIAAHGAGCLIWTDESHVDERTKIRKYGRKLRGERAKAESVLRVGGERYSVLGIFDLEHGSVAHHAVVGSIDTEEFFHALLHKIIPHMNAYPGPRSVLILDNCSTHRQQQILWAVDAIGAIVEFLPPYACDVAMHEKCLRSAKAYLMHMKTDEQFCALPPLDQIDIAMRSVGPNDVKAGMRECGYIL